MYFLWGGTTRKNRQLVIIWAIRVNWTVNKYLKNKISFVFDVSCVITSTAQKMKFSIEDFFSKCDQICSFLRIWSHWLNKSSMKNLIFCAVRVIYGDTIGTKLVFVCRLHKSDMTGMAILQIVFVFIDLALVKSSRSYPCRG